MSFRKSGLVCVMTLCLTSCVAVPAYEVPPGYYSSGVSYEYYPDYNYYYGGPYPALYGSVGYYDWGYWHGHDGHEHWEHHHR